LNSRVLARVSLTVFAAVLASYLWVHWSFVQGARLLF